MRDETKWWPSGVESIRPPFRAGEVCYGLLGPGVTHHLLEFTQAAVAAGVDPPADVARLLEELDRADGTAPDYLVLFGVAVAMAMEMSRCDVDPTASELDHQLRRHSGTVMKFVGSVVQEAYEQFGFTQDTFTEWVQRDWAHFDGATWPPPGAAYTTTPPS